MIQDKFLQQLKTALKGLSKEEQIDILQDYKEHFSFGLEAGKTESEIAASLGNPDQIAKEILANYHIKQANSTGSLASIIRAMFALGALGFFNLVIVLGPALVVATMIFIGWLLSAVFAVMPILALISAILNPGSITLFEMFFSIMACGGGALGGVIMWYVTKFVKKASIGYLKFNMRLVKGA